MHTQAHKNRTKKKSHTYTPYVATPGSFVTQTDFKSHRGRRRVKGLQTISDRFFFTRPEGKKNEKKRQKRQKRDRRTEGKANRVEENNTQSNREAVKFAETRQVCIQMTFRLPQNKPVQRCKRVHCRDLFLFYSFWVFVHAQLSSSIIHISQEVLLV